MVRVEDAHSSQLDLALLVLNDPGARLTGGIREPRLHHYCPYHYRGTSGVANKSPNTSGNKNRIDARSQALGAHDPSKLTATVEPIDSISGGTGAQLDKRHGHSYPYHSCRLADTSKGEHS
ncbi:hypothetical protein FRC08_005054 [Ceratobasidium sp. 394]|nr:hypothetical protein FRC08_005054 [Ceratobasidium sp. 394]